MHELLQHSPVEGPVRKRGQLSGAATFSMRYFVLRDATLEYYDTKGGKLKGEIPLGGRNAYVSSVGKVGFNVEAVCASRI